VERSELTGTSDERLKIRFFVGEIVEKGDSRIDEMMPVHTVKMRVHTG